MYIYNVTIKVADQIEHEWLSWMKEIHLNEVLATGMFHDYALFALLEPVDEEGKTYIAQYYTQDHDTYLRYINEFAPSLREKGFERFGNQFIAFRSVMQKVFAS